ncbi:MAG: hypothetical protein SOZ84_07530 [Treponema sp.]|nr:hypothetical protein [Treponema sp.]
MKKLFVLLGGFCALCFVACSNFQLAGGDMGMVSLSIGDNLAREIRSAAASRNVADGTYTLTASIRGEYSDSQTVAVANGNYSGVTFTFEDVPVGKRIILDLTAKADGNYIWYGNSGKHMVVSGINNLNVAVGRVSGVLMWKLENHNILTAPYGAYDSPAEREITFGASDSSQGRPFCFDSDGNLYVMPSDGSTVKKYDLQLDGTYVDSKTDISTNGQVFNHLAYDSVAGTLYGIGTQTQLCYWKSGERFNQVQGDTVNSGSYLGLAAHDNVVYTIKPGREDLNAVHYATVKSYSISIEGSDAGDTAQPTLKVVKENSFLLPSFCTRNYTGQMIYQDGALYLLLRRVEVSNSGPTEGDSERFSCGALVKINPSTLTLDTSFGDNGYLGLVSGRPISGIYDNRPYFSMKLYSPTESNESRAFYGPVGFVAVMPKKLVIADAGCALSKGSGDKLLARRKNRVVTVDLETQAFAVTPLSDPNSYGNVASSCGFLVVE